MTSADPIQRFGELFKQAQSVVKGRDFNAMVLSTLTADGHPASRVVLLKGWDPLGFVFYTNTQSRKGLELSAHPHAALNFHWPELGVQVRAEGPVEPVTAQEADAYFASRARESQLGAWASKQSEGLPSRAELENRYAEFERQFQGKPVPRPPHWSGYRLLPTLLEFWKDMPSRLHVREEFTRDKPTSAWNVRGLFP